MTDREAQVARLAEIVKASEGVRASLCRPIAEYLVAHGVRVVDAAGGREPPVNRHCGNTEAHGEHVWQGFLGAQGFCDGIGPQTQPGEPPTGRAGGLVQENALHQTMPVSAATSPASPRAAAPELAVDFGPLYPGHSRIPVTEYAVLPSGRIVAMGELNGRESYWFEPDGSSPKGGFLVGWPGRAAAAPECPHCDNCGADLQGEFRIIISDAKRGRNGTFCSWTCADTPGSPPERGTAANPNEGKETHGR